MGAIDGSVVRESEVHVQQNSSLAQSHLRPAGQKALGGERNHRSADRRRGSRWARDALRKGNSPKRFRRERERSVWLVGNAVPVVDSRLVFFDLNLKGGVLRLGARRAVIVTRLLFGTRFVLRGVLLAQYGSNCVVVGAGLVACAYRTSRKVV